MKLKAVVFDFDGVLADTALDIGASIRATQRQYGARVMETPEIISHVGFGAKYLVDHTVPVGDERKMAEVLGWYKAYYEAHPCDITVLFDGIRETLETFRLRGVPMCIVSNKPEAITRLIAEQLGIAPFFTRIVGPESVTKMKPDPEGLLLCAREMFERRGEPLDLSACMMVGDAYTDIQAGKAAGFGATCAVLYGYGNREKLLAAGATYQVENGRGIAALPV